MLAAFTDAASGQVIPGGSMQRSDLRTEVVTYRLGVQDELLSVLRDWARLAESRDSLALASLFTQSARSIASGVADAAGPADIVRQLWGLSWGGARVNVMSDDFDTSGDLAYVSCTLTIQPTAQGGPAATTDARVLFVLLRDDRGRWHIRQQTIAVAAPT